MIFELSHENITTALREYMDRRNIINGKDFTFLMKTSRKGEKTSRVIITAVDVVVAPLALTPATEAVVAPEVVTVSEVPPSVVEEPQEEVVEAKSTPFKKLFAA